MSSANNNLAGSRSGRPKKQSLELALGLKEPSGIMALLTEAGVPGLPTEGARDLPLGLIDHNPYQSRQVFDLQSLQELADSIREHGVIEPIIVRGTEGRYQIIAGERRYRAAVLAGQESIPARIMTVDMREAAIITALENLQREDLDIEDEARQYVHLCEMLHVSHRELAKMLGKNNVYISRRVRLLKRPDLMEAYRSGKLTLHEATGLAEPISEGIHGISVSAGNTLGPDEDLGYTGQIELIERDDLTGFVVTRPAVASDSSVGSEPGSALSSVSAGNTTDTDSVHRAKRPLFRWRPLQQFYNWVGRTNVTDIPEDERASVRAQLTEIKEALEKQIAELEEISE